MFADRLRDEIVWRDSGPWMHLTLRCPWLSAKKSKSVIIVPDWRTEQPWCPCCLELVHDDPLNQIQRLAVRVPDFRNFKLIKLLRRIRFAVIFVDDDREVFHLFERCALQESEPELKKLELRLLNGRYLSRRTKANAQRVVCEKCFRTCLKLNRAWFEELFGKLRPGTTLSAGTEFSSPGRASYVSVSTSVSASVAG